MEMKPITMLSVSDASVISYVLTDIDDTLTENGKLLPEAYTALWELKNAGITVIPVTGRPAGWCDMIIRQWPVDAVIGENGAFVYFFENGLLRQFVHPSVAAPEIKVRLQEIGRDVLERVPGTRIAKDQFSRLYDLAIDFREEPPYLDLDTAENIRRICEEHGARAKISSIHVNTWYGEYDKVSMAVLFLKDRFGFKAVDRHRVLYCGDSPNDEPMFAYFPVSCGVANVEPFLHLMTHKPSYITELSHGRGFAEAASVVLRARASRNVPD